MKTNYSLSQLASIYCVYKDLSPLTHSITCCTCGKIIHIEQIEDCFNLWGHYIARSVNRNLIYNPINSHAQCINCNVINQGMYNEYKRYMQYRYGENIENILLNADIHDNEYYKNFYITELAKLSSVFPELLNIIVDVNTGEILPTQQVFENSIENQFYTFSSTYKDDLDTLCKILKVNFIEWERL